FLVYLHFIAVQITHKKGFFAGIFFLVLVLALLRILIYALPGIFYFRQFQLFDPSIYAANWFNASLGDLLLNAVIFCWVVVFAWFNIDASRRLPQFLNGRKGWIAGI